MDLDEIFHLFDIRGEYPRKINETLAFKIGKLLTKKVLVGHDQRNSSYPLSQALLSGLPGEGEYVGEVSTPLFSFIMKHNPFDFGVMVTASHIDESQNGFKIFRNGGVPLNEGEMLELKKRLGSAEYKSDPAGKFPVNDALKTKSIALYCQFLTEKFKLVDFTGLGKVVFDTGETPVTFLVRKILPQLKIDYIHLDKPRGLNPMLAENRRVLAESVRTSGSSLGIIFDGDGDRAIFVDRNGELIHPSYIFGLVNRNYHKVVLDMRAGLVAKTTQTVFVPSWSQNIKYAMIDDPEIEMGGEVSGHAVFREWSMIDDGIFFAIKTLSLFDMDFLKKMEGALVELEETNFPRHDNYPLVLEKVANYYRDRGESVSIIDGVTVWGEDFRFNLRPSLTEPFLRLNLEARTNEKKAEIYGEVRSFI